MSEKLACCRRWAYEYVIDLNLCPFAKKAMDQDKIEWIELSDIGLVDKCIESFVHSSKDSIFLVLEGMDFSVFLDVLYMIRMVIADLGYEDDLRLVSFHPNHIFEGMDEENPVIYANRAPYPMIQLLRMSDLNAIQLSEIDKEEILENNERILKKLGLHNLEKRLNEFRAED